VRCKNAEFSWEIPWVNLVGRGIEILKDELSEGLQVGSCKLPSCQCQTKREKKRFGKHCFPNYISISKPFMWWVHYLDLKAFLIWTMLDRRVFQSGINRPMILLMVKSGMTASILIPTYWWEVRSVIACPFRQNRLWGAFHHSPESLHDSC
jgi:hypothetical protein